MLAKRVFITGLEGFTGHYLKQELKAHGYEVFGTIRLGQGNNDGSVLQCDLMDTNRLSMLIKTIKPDFIINLAGIAFVSHSSPIEMYQVNQLGVLSLLEAIAASSHTPEKIILTSSAHVYGNQTSTPIAETCDLWPMSDYAVSKLAMERLAHIWFDRLPIIIVRPFNYTGVGQSVMFLPAKIVSHFVKKAASIELGNLDIARDWSDVRDVVAIYRLLLTSEASSVMVNVCSGLSYSLEYILKTLSELSGHTISIQVNPNFMRANEIKELSGDNTLLFSLIERVKLREMRETLGWMLEV